MLTSCRPGRAPVAASLLALAVAIGGGVAAQGSTATGAGPVGSPVTVPPLTAPPLTAPPLTAPPLTAPPLTAPPLTASPVTVPPVFAWPWEISLDRIAHAMRGTYYRVEQERRLLDTSDPRQLPTWIAILEELKHLPAVAGTSERFDLTLKGIEGQGPPTPQQRQRFAEQAGFLNRHQSFMVSSVELAVRHYRISFFGIGMRIQRPVYIVGVFSSLGMRSGWLLELDIETGYPLYRGEYGIDGKLVSEVEVTRYDPAFRGTATPPLDVYGTQQMSSVQMALSAVGLHESELAQELAKNTIDLPDGYELVKQKVITDPFHGGKRAILVYTDGIDDLFIMLSPDTRQSLAQGHVIDVYRDPAGMTQCSFIDRKVQVLVVGRTDPVVRSQIEELYVESIRYPKRG